MPFDALPCDQFARQQATLAMLRQVRDRLATEGAWCKEFEVRPDGARCLLGWVNYFTLRNLPGVANRCLEALAKEAHRTMRRKGSIPGYQMEIALFNDRASTRQATVVRLIDRVIAAMEGEQCHLMH